MGAHSNGNHITYDAINSIKKEGTILPELYITSISSPVNVNKFDKVLANVQDRKPEEVAKKEIRFEGNAKADFVHGVVGNNLSTYSEDQHRTNKFMEAYNIMKSKDGSGHNCGGTGMGYNGQDCGNGYRPYINTFNPADIGKIDRINIDGIRKKISDFYPSNVADKYKQQGEHK